jgi:hypothetical protein
VIGALAVREAIGEPDSGRRLAFYWEQQVSHLILDDQPRLAATEVMLLDEMLRAFDADMPADAEADVVGPIVVDLARAREIAEHFGAVVGDINLATTDVEENWPPNMVMLVAGAHIPAEARA